MSVFFFGILVYRLCNCRAKTQNHDVWFKENDTKIWFIYNTSTPQDVSCKTICQLQSGTSAQTKTNMHQSKGLFSTWNAMALLEKKVAEGITCSCSRLIPYMLRHSIYMKSRPTWRLSHELKCLQGGAIGQRWKMLL